jgi:hypothetical protein
MKNRITSFFLSLNFSSLFSHLPLSYLLLTFLTLFSGSVATAQIPSSGLVGYWNFSGNVNDASSNGNNGIMQPGNNGSINFVTDRFGNANSAIEFTSNPTFSSLGPYIEIPNSQNLLVNSDFTMSYSIKVSAQNVIGEIINKGADAIAYSYFSRVANGILQNSIPTSGIINVSNFPIGSWQTVTITYSNSLLSYYLNGVFQQSVASSPIQSSSSKFYFGSMVSGSSNGSFYPFQGVMDDISIYNRALTPAEITQLYTDQTSLVEVPCTPFLGEDQTVCAGTSVTLSASGSSLACPTLPSTLQNGLVGYWPFCGNANDASGNGNNGTVNGATLTADRFGSANSAYSFDGANDIIQILDDPSLNFGVNPSFTISFWMNKTLANSSGVISKGEPQNGYGWRGWNFISNAFETGYPCVNNYNSIPTSASSWHHVLIKIENGSITAFVDYAQSFQFNCSNITTTSISTSSNLYFGVDRCLNNFFTGKLDDVAIYNRVLTQAEIQQLFTLGQSTYLWSTGATTASISVTPTQTTTYTCTVTDANGNACTDSVTVFVPQIEATDLTICAGESTTLSVSGINSTATPSACPTLPSNLQSGLVGYWPFCGNANDASGNGNNGTVNGATLTTDRFGNANSAFSLSGTSNSILVNDSPSLDFPQGVFSLCAEVKLSGLGVEQGLIDHLDVGGPSVLSRYTLRVLPNNKIRFNLKDDENDWSSVDSDISLDINVWYSIVGVFNYATQELHIYINGEIHDGTIIYNSLTGPAITPPNSLFLGNFAGAYNLNGTIDNVSIYNRALSASEIQQLYTLGQSTYLWSTGATTASISVTPTQTTTYTCTVTDANGNACTDSVTVFVPQIEATDLTICAGESITLSVTGINSTATPACAALPTNLQSGLVGYWPFCGNANDASGNGNHWIVNGATLTSDRFGNSNSAYSFDGISNYLSVSNSTPFDLVNEISMSMWVKPSQIFGMNLFDRMPYSEAYGYRVNLRLTGDIWGQIGAGTNSVYANISPLTYIANQWCHITAVISNHNYVKIYFNGVLISTVNTSISFNAFSEPFEFGRWAQSVSIAELFKGSADDLAFWSRALTASEIQQLYTLGQSTYSWSNGATTASISVTPSTTTTYTCTVTDANGNACTDSVTVVVNNPTINLGSDVTACGTSTTLTAPTGYDSYAWSNGGTTNTTTVTANGTYTCTVTQGLCSASDSIDVTLIDATISATDSIICAGETTTLSVPQGVSSNTSSATLPTNLQNGLVGYWPFCGNANDASGNGNNGTVNGATLTTDRFGNANSAYSFDGVNDWIDISTGFFNNGWNDMSINLWFNSASNNSTTGPGQTFLNTSPHTGISMGYSYQGNQRVYVFKNSNPGISSWDTFANTQFNASQISLNTWHNVSIVKSGLMYQFYFDGQLDNTLNTTNAALNYFCNLRFGAITCCSPEVFNGKLDDISIFSRSLTSSEIQQIYNFEQTSYLWSTGATTASINVTPTQTTTYTCTITTNGVTCTDSVTVLVNNPILDLGSDVTVCGTSTTLTAPIGYDSYVWSNSGTTNTTTVTANGTYTCTVTQEGCSASDAVDVTLIDATISATDSVICAGETITLSVPQGGSSNTTCAVLPTNLQTGLVGYWPFCGNANDASGNGNNGTVNGATLTTDRFGNGNSAYYFNGLNASIQTMDSPSISLNGDLTMSAWKFEEASNQGYHTLISKRLGGNWSYNLVISKILGGSNLEQNKIFTGRRNNGGSQTEYRFSNNQVQEGIWQHVAVTISNNQIKFYINGVDAGYVAGYNGSGGYVPFGDMFTIPMINQPTGLTFGDNNDGGSEHLKGSLDDIAIFNRALSFSEIQQLYSQNQTTYLWSNGATTPTINVSPTTTTTYTCTVTTNGVSCTDTITVVVGNPVASITPNGIVEICEGESIALTGNGGASYLWSTGAPTQSITVNTEAVYTVTVTDENGCTDTESQLVKVNFPPNIGVSNASICAGQAATLTASGGVSYVWSPATGLSATTGTTVTASPATSTVYSVTGTGANGCTNTATAAVAVNALPTATITASSATTFCQGGSVVLTANTGAGLSYQWFNNATSISGATSSTNTANASGSYTVVVTNASTCSSTSAATVVTVNALPTATITPASATTFCQGGSVVLNANTGTGLTYQWFNNATVISGATSASYTAITSGSYAVVVTNTSTCSSTSIATVVTVNALPTATITPATATTFCQGGSVVLNANTGTGLTYQWFNNATAISGATSASYTATTSGSFTVTVTNASTCSSTSTATVVTVNAIPTATITPATATTFCQGGSVLLNANTGAGLTYQWRLNGNPISGATSSSYTANASGSYTVVVTNTSTCSATSTATVVTVNALPTATITPATATTFCQGGSVVLNANTGTGLMYQWFNNATAISGATTSTFTANVSGSYTVTVTNASTCSLTSTATVVTVNALPTATITPATATTFCQGGSVVLNANTGTGLSYQWRLNGNPISGATSSSYTANASGSYTVVVTNASTCSSTSTAVVVTVNTLPTATITPATATTFCQGGSVVLNANTGTGLTYQWFNNATAISGATSASYTATTSGSFTVTVTNTSTCSSTSTATVVTVNALPAATITPATATTFCQGGSVVLNANTGAGLTYQWRLNGNPISGATSSSYTANASGSYTVVVTNASTCSSTSTATVVTVNALPTATITPATATTFCQGSSVVLNANTGTGLTYQWLNNATAISGATSASYTATMSGSYTVVVTNASTCSSTSTATVVTVNALPTATITASSATTFCQGGSVVLNANTGAGLSYQWRLNGNPISGATSSSYTANASGSYTVVVTNASTCSATSTATVVTVNALPTATITASSATTFCQGGSVVLTANTGAGLSYQWFNNANAISGATSASYTASMSGSYTVVVTNASTCSSTSTATVVTVNALPTATITPATATTFCQGGSVVLNANTGAGLSYQWRLNGNPISGATSSSYTANASGSYTVVVTNTATCSSTSTATVVTVNALPTATITASSATTFCQGGSVVLSANTGAGLSYQWRLNGNPISGATSSSYTANASGSYTVVVTNASTCSSTSTATVVTVNALPTATITPATATTFCQGGSVVLNANTGAGLSYQWFNNATSISGATSASYTASMSGSYTVVVTNTATCSSTSTATVVTVNALSTATITASSATTFCQGGSVVLSANTGAGLSYQWRLNGNPISGATSSSYTANASGSYTVVVTNASTCSSTSTATVVTVNALPTATITPATATTFCQGGSVVLNANTGAGLSYQWRLNGNPISGATSSSYTANASGSYTVVVTNASTCSSTSTATVVTVNALPTATITASSATTFCQGGSVVLTANTGAGLSYQWRLNGNPISGATSSSYTANASGSYTVVVTNASTCSSTSTATVVTVNALPTATITAATATTFCQGEGVVLNASTGTGLTYQWFNNASAISGATSASYTATTSGSYTVVVTNASTCSSTSTAIDVTAVPNVDYFADTDGDGFGDVTTLISTCVQPQGYVTDSSDCNDNDAAIFPGAQEICNDVDDDCNELIDDGLVFTTYYADADGDSFGDANNSLDACLIPDGYVTNSTDCNDNNANQNATSPEICNGEDDDCDGTIDNGITFLDYYADADGDGFGAGDVISSCSDLGAGYVSNNTDCDDSNSNTNPSATEICNTIDDNCDGQIDEGVQTVYFIDNDGDTYGNPSVSILACTQPIGYTPDDTDCNDTDANINPGAEDIGGNGIDENCDGEIDNSIFELNASINLFPNPTRSELNIQVTNALVGNEMYIFDAVGKLVYKQQLLSTQTTVSVSNLADGNYIVRVGEMVKRFEVMK